MDQTDHHLGTEQVVQQLKARATEFLLGEQWNDYTSSTSDLISFYHNEISKAHETSDSNCVTKLRKSLCSSLSNCANASFRLNHFQEGLRYCDHALEIDPSHFKSLLCKGKIMLSLNKYSSALSCFENAHLDPQCPSSKEILSRYLKICKNLGFQARTGVLDLSDWVTNGCNNKNPELAEYIGAIKIKKSEISGLGMFALNDIDAGTPLLCTKSIAIERVLLNNIKDAEQHVMWRNFVHKVRELTTKSCRICHLVSKLSSGEDEDGRIAPDMNIFKPDTDESFFSSEKLGWERLFSILDVNCLIEDAASSKILGKNGEFFGVGLWILPSFVNHSCCPNSRRLHVGDHMIVHASRNIKEGEEITFSYFDMLFPFYERQKMCENWGFQCGCSRCRFEKGIFSRTDMICIELGIDRGLEPINAVCRLEEIMKRMGLKGMEKGYLRSSFWGVYSDTYTGEKSVRKWERKIPPMEIVVRSILQTVGSDERVLKVLVRELKKGGYSMDFMERVLMLGRDLYGNIVKKRQALRILLNLDMDKNCSF